MKLARLGSHQRLGASLRPLQLPLGDSAMLDWNRVELFFVLVVRPDNVVVEQFEGRL